MLPRPRPLGLVTLAATLALASVVSLASLALACGKARFAPTLDVPDGGDADGSLDGAPDAPSTTGCPNVPAGTFPQGHDTWSALITMRDPPDPGNDPQGKLYIPPIHAVMLTNGSVLVTANMRDTTGPGQIIDTNNFIITPDTPTADADLRPPRIPFINRGDVNNPDNLFCMGQAHLSDGRVMTIGGTRAGQPPDNHLYGLDYAEIFDPKVSPPTTATSWSIIAPRMLGKERWYPTLTRLPGGRMLASSGQYIADKTNNHSIESYDPSTGAWTLLSADAESPKGIELTEDYTHVWSLPRPVSMGGSLHDVLVMGESGAMFHFASDPGFTGKNTARWHVATQRPFDPDKAPVGCYGCSGVMLPLLQSPTWYTPGSVLEVGGTEDEATGKRADVYDPTLDTWCPLVKDLGIWRLQGSTVLLPDGNILIVSGHAYNGDPPTPTQNSAQRTPQILDPRTGAMWTGSPWPDPAQRAYHNTAVLLPDARVLIMGGRTYTGKADLDGNWDERPDLRYYSPPYLEPLTKGAARPQIDGLPTDPAIHYGKPYVIDVSQGPIDGAAIIGLAAQTHSFDQNQRYIQLAYQATGGQLILTGPNDAGMAPQGPYLLFVMHKIDGWMVPSVAKIVMVN